MSYSERLKEVRLYLHLTQEKFAYSIGIQNKQTISDVENNRQKELQTIAELMMKENFNIDLHWLRTGEGSMILAENSCVEEDNLNYRKLSPDIEIIIEVLKEMNTEKRRSVLRYVLELSDVK